MEFHVNHPLLYIMAGFLIAAVLAQSVFFLVKAYRRSAALGMDMKKVKKTIISAAIFTMTVLPAMLGSTIVSALFIATLA